MMKNNRFLYVCMFLLTGMLLLNSCSDESEEKNNDCLKRSEGPNVVGGTMEFAYAMALPKTEGHWIEATVVATFPGAAGTTLENISYHTDGSGFDQGVVIGNPCENIENRTKVTFARDTCAATLRYHYVVPEEARGKQVSFMFTATSSTGKVVSRGMGPYQVSNMDMALDIVLKNRDCFSLTDMRVLTAAEATANPEKVDFVYSYQALRGVIFRHALVSPTAANIGEFLKSVSLPAGLSNSTRMVRTYGSCDQQLARDEYGVFVDDIDFQTKSFDKAPDYIINLPVKGGAWMETSDGRYRAYLYVNAATETRAGMTISMKRMKMW